MAFLAKSDWCMQLFIDSVQFLTYNFIIFTDIATGESFFLIPVKELSTHCCIRRSNYRTSVVAGPSASVIQLKCSSARVSLLPSSNYSLRGACGSLHKTGFSLRLSPWVLWLEEVCPLNGNFC